MTSHSHAPHHHAPPAPGFSLLQASAVTRLAIAALASGALWLAVAFALDWI